MKIASFVGAKGGTGKSSTSLITAWELSKTHKKRVALIDADVQGTCMSAKALNTSLPFDVVSAGNKKQLWEAGKSFSEKGYDYLIIDGNPRSIHEDPELISVIAQLSDLNVIVSRPAPRDLKAQLIYVDIVKKATKGSIFLLWNFFQKNTGAHRDGIPEGEKMLGLASFKTRMGLRIAYQDVGYGEGYVGDLQNKEVLKEVRALGAEVKRILDGQKA